MLCKRNTILQRVLFLLHIIIIFLQHHDPSLLKSEIELNVNLLPKAHPDNVPVLSELCATLSRLAVRNEFCQDIVDLGGLKFMMTLLAESLDCQVRGWFVASV